SKFKAAARRLRSFLTVHYEAELTRVYPDPVRGVVDVEVNAIGRGIWQSSFGMLITCTGFGTERCSIGRYTGFRFWDTDELENRDFGLPQGVTPKILISGGGDGSLQDFIRVVTTCRSAKELYQWLLGATVNGGMALWPAIEAAVHSAEDQAQRAYTWSMNQHEHAIFSTLHSAYEGALDELQSNSLVWYGISNVLGQLVRDPVPSVKLVYSCTHFTKCYGLNQFLVLLLLRFLQNYASGAVEELDNTRVEAVFTADSSVHSCNNNPMDCCGNDHEIVYRYKDCSDSQPNLFFKDDPGTYYNHVILRHGPEPPNQIHWMNTPTSPLASYHTVRLPRQMLPYHISS
ncbi:MAG: hypothetical protein M3328_07650, partial [Chloroflexota bacterium]|nr:hypothetical protein [Chloroflexota bacterium]